MHDRENFEVFLYALNPDDGSAQRRRLETEVEHFRDLSTLTAGEAAVNIANDGWESRRSCRLVVLFVPLLWGVARLDESIWQCRQLKLILGREVRLYECRENAQQGLCQQGKRFLCAAL